MTVLTANSANGVLIRDVATVVIRGDMTGCLNESGLPLKFTPYLIRGGEGQ